jgi:hypothetical protein
LIARKTFRIARDQLSIGRIRTVLLANSRELIGGFLSGPSGFLGLLATFSRDAVEICLVSLEVSDAREMLKGLRERLKICRRIFQKARAQ